MLRVRVRPLLRLPPPAAMGLPLPWRRVRSVVTVRVSAVVRDRRGPVRVPATEGWRIGIRLWIIRIMVWIIRIRTVVRTRSGRVESICHRIVARTFDANVCVREYARA